MKSTLLALFSLAIGAPLSAQPAYQATSLHTFQTPEGTSPVALTRNADGSFTGIAKAGAAGNGSVFKITPSGALTVLHNLTSSDAGGAIHLITAPDGAIYGVAFNGGTGGCPNGCGTIFRVTTGGVFSVLYNFTGGADGANPASLFLGADGAIYGPAQNGGAGRGGTIFRFLPPAGPPAVLYTFCTSVNCPDGGAPASLIAGLDGNLYGTTTGSAKLFRLTPGGVFSVVKQFVYDNGASPDNLLQAPDGSFFFTFESDPYGSGRIAQLTTSGQLNILQQFRYTDGNPPYAMNWGTDGSIYGVGRGGGNAGGYGIAFRLTTAGAYSTLFNFSNLFEGGSPYAIAQGSDSLLYGAAATGGVDVSGACNQCGTIFKLTPVNAAAPSVTSFIPASGPAGSTVTVNGSKFTGTTGASIDGVALPFSVLSDTQLSVTIPAAAATGAITVTNASGSSDSPTPFQILPDVYQTLYRFCPGSPYPSCPDGISPNGLFIGRDGNFYGTSNWSSAVSTLFRITPTGQLTTIAGGLDLLNPVVQARDGNFYGTAASGGWYGNAPCYTSFPEPPTGCGYVFRVTQAGKVTTLYRFKGYLDGAFPASNVVQGPDGAIYGTTSSFGKHGKGTIFRITTAGSFLPVFGFSGTDGNVPNGLYVSSGAIYGTTASGGSGGKGTVYKLNANGTITTLYNFSGPDGDTPNSLAFSGGVVYGTTLKGGPGGAGVAFKIDTNGTFSSIYSFTGMGGGNPARILYGSGGNLYGILSSGGAFNGGTVFKLTTQGQLTVMYPFVNLFNGSTDGFSPTTLVQSADGALWGTTSQGGDGTCYPPRGCGVFFKLQ